MACKACHDANLLRTSPAVSPPQHGMQEPPTTNRLQCQHTMQDPTTTPQCQHVTQDPATMPPPTQYAKWSSGGNSGSGGQWDDGGEDGSNVRHSYYLRLYIFYLCNKLILFLYFVRLKL